MIFDAVSGQTVPRACRVEDIMYNLASATGAVASRRRIQSKFDALQIGAMTNFCATGVLKQETIGRS